VEKLHSRGQNSELKARKIKFKELKNKVEGKDYDGVTLD
jgi:hypothetical protein